MRVPLQSLGPSLSRTSLAFHLKRVNGSCPRVAQLTALSQVFHVDCDRSLVVTQRHVRVLAASMTAVVYIIHDLEQAVILP